MKTISLSQGYVAIVDDGDYDRVIVRGSWNVCIRPTVKYAMHSYRENGKRKTEYLHRFLMGEPVGVEVDHKNGNGLDCQRGNLRLLTHQQNAMNRGRNAKGVSWHKRTQKWRAYIKVDRKHVSLGCFDRREDAEAARLAGVIRYFGDFAYRTVVEDAV